MMMRFGTKVFANVEDGDHNEHNNKSKHTLVGYQVKFLLCHVKEDKKACEFVYGDGEESLCYGKIRDELADCKAIRS